MVAVVYAVGRALLDAYFMLDDYGMLAIARFVEAPLQYFVADHIPGSLYYRPVGMLSWWLSERVFGAAASLHYALNLMLHAAVAWVLWRTLVAAGLRGPLAFMLALVFALHPVSMGTTAWLSDRFDLLAALFGLLAVRITIARGTSLRVVDGAAVLAWLALALLSKEIALSCAAAILALWWTAGRAERPGRWLLMLVALVAGYLALRAVVIADAGAAKLFEHHAPFDALLRGLREWMSGGIEYGLHAARLNGWKRLLLGAGLLAAGIAVLRALPMSWDRARWRLLLAGAALLVTPAFLQWPLLASTEIAMEPSTGIMLVVINSRHFYLAGAGLALCVAGVLKPLADERSTWHVVAIVAMALLAVPWLSAAQRLTDQHRNETRRQREIVVAADAAIRQADLPKPCIIFLLGTTDWSFRWISDEAIKGTIVQADFARVSSCLIQTEHTPWYHIVRRGSIDASRIAPLEFARGLEGEDSRLRLGSAETLALNLDARIDPRKVPGALFLAWRNGRFVDVGDEVERGSYRVDFSCNRPASQCTP